MFFFFFSSRRRHTRYWRDWSSDVCSSDLLPRPEKTTPRSGECPKAGCVGFGGRRGGARAARGGLASGRDGGSMSPVSLVQDRESVGEGKSVDLGGRRII